MTAGLMIVIILFLNEEGIAKLASAFQLLIFMMLNFAVIVMRESRITSYDPGYRSPLYPWMQIAGIITANALLVYLGTQALMLTFLTVVVCLVWYFYYAHNRVMRDGALYHWFAQLGQNRYEGLDYELWQIMREKGLREEDPFDELVARATVLRVEHDFERSDITFQDLVGRVTEILGAQVPATAAELKNGFLEESRMGAMPAETGVLLPNLLLFDIQQSEMVLVHSRRGLHVDLTDVHGEHSPDNPIHAFCFLVSPEEEAKQHLRILAQIADRMDEEDFINEWLRTEDPQELKEILLRGKRFLTLRLRPDSPARILIGKELREIDMPTGNLVVMIRRNEHTIIPRGRTKLQEGDYVVIIGEPASIGEFRQRYMDQEGAQPAVRNEITVVHGANHAPPVKQLTNHVSNPASDETENESVPK
jgi:mannitol/fructose-specific phosphotransferase system IIA component (Ntr-type)